MSENYELGKKGKFGSFDFSKIKSGITREEMLAQKKEFAAIFDMIDTDKNSTLSRKELSLFMQKTDRDSDLTISEKEISELKRENNLNTKNLKEIFSEFLLEISGKMDASGVKEVKIVDDDIEVIKYENGVEEKIFADGKREILVKQDSKSLVQKYDSEGNLLEEIAEVTLEDGSRAISVVTYEKNIKKEIKTTCYNSEGEITKIETKTEGETTIEEFNGNIKTETYINHVENTSLITISVANELIYKKNATKEKTEESKYSPSIGELPDMI